MADALCGPSNALQTFRKHTSVDRTLQQDRLVGRGHSPSQGFRSHDPRAGSLDADFHAFENAPTNTFNMEQPAWAQTSHRSSPQPSNASWASDFQNLHISNAPLPSHQMRVAAPLVTTTNGGWGQEFMRQRQNMTPVQQGKQPEMISTASPMFNSLQNPSFQAPRNQYATNQQNVMHEQQMQDPSFDRAFQEAFDSIQQSEFKDIAVEEAAPLTEPVHDFGYEQALLQPTDVKLGSDAIDYVEQKDRTPDQDSKDADDLARVAGVLLQNVSHEQNEKFQNSKFLDLMKKIRDREIEVRNDDFESTYVDHAAPQSAMADQSSLSQQQQYPDPFAFPDMNSVYAPDSRIDGASEYSFDADQFPYQPYNQISDLHPGGPRYPEQSPRQRHAQMSGAVISNDTVTDGAGSSYHAA